MYFPSFFFSDDYEQMPPMPTGRHDTGYHPPVPPSPTYNNDSRGDRHAESKEAYEMSQRTTPVQSDGTITTDQFFQEVFIMYIHMFMV